MSAHTPGPWAVDITTNDNREAETVRGPDGVRIAATYKVHEHRIDKTAAWYESRANSKLIAAAPDLLAALQKIDSNAAESVEWIRRVAREAIAKATGGAA
jgi:hypothetical protein